MYPINARIKKSINSKKQCFEYSQFVLKLFMDSYKDNMASITNIIIMITILVFFYFNKSFKFDCLLFA